MPQSSTYLGILRRSTAGVGRRTPGLPGAREMFGMARQRSFFALRYWSDRHDCCGTRGVDADLCSLGREVSAVGRVHDELQIAWHPTAWRGRFAVQQWAPADVHQVRPVAGQAAAAVLDPGPLAANPKKRESPELPPGERVAFSGAPNRPRTTRVSGTR